MRRITDAGLPCGVMVAPVLPLLTDSAEALDALLARIAAAGATGATVLALHLRPGTREWFQAWLAREHPALVEPYARLYRRGRTWTRRTGVPSRSAWHRCCAATGSRARSPRFRRRGRRAPARPVPCPARSGCTARSPPRPELRPPARAAVKVRGPERSRSHAS